MAKQRTLKNTTYLTMKRLLFVVFTMAALLLVPFAHQMEGWYGFIYVPALPSSVLQTIAGVMDTYFAPMVHVQPVSGDRSFDASVYNAIGLHLPEGGLTLDRLVGTEKGRSTHRLVRRSRAQGAFYFEGNLFVIQFGSTQRNTLHCRLTLLGWYYKLVTADQARSVAIIPGVLLNEKEE
jgi:hypothetical protein